MRLKPEEVRAIIESFELVLAGTRSKLYLFGSRADPKKRGGDIDLLVLAPDSKTAQGLGKERQRTSLRIQERGRTIS